MKDRSYLLNTLLAAVLGAALLIATFVRAFAPAIIIPQLNLPNMVLICLLVQLLEHYLAPDAKRCYVCIPLLSVLTFGLLPWVAGFLGTEEIWKTALCGAAVFTAVTWLFTSLRERIASGPAAKGAAIISAMGMYLAAQCLTGIIL